MIEVVYGQSEVVAKFVAAAMKDPAFNRGFGNCTAIGVAENGNLIGGCVYHDYAPEAGIIEISAASVSKKWLNKRTLFALFSYPFDQIGVQMVVMRTSVNNRQANGRGMARISAAYGFTQIPIPRLYGRHEDGLLHCLTEEAWRANGFH